MGKDNFDLNNAINDASDILSDINAIKDEICKFPLNTCESAYINTNIVPLLTVLNQLSNVSSNLSTSANYLTQSPIVHYKNSDVKETIHLIYRINDKCADIYEILRVRINIVLNSADICCK